jgi:hypothetical protein
MATVGIAMFDLYTLPLIYLPLTLAGLGLGVFCVSSMAYLNGMNAPVYCVFRLRVVWYRSR